MKKYYVYIIGKKEEMTEPYVNCYVGVTNNLALRWKYHENSKYYVGKYIREYNLTIENNMQVIFEGAEQECFELESKYRPIPFIGLNEASGGKGGHTSYSKERNEKISKAMKAARPKKKWGPTSSPDRTGRKNPNSKTWTLNDPKGNIYQIKGNLTQFCEEHKILESSLRYYKNDTVPMIAENSLGGFRSKNEKSKQFRMNTIGWTLVRGGV